MSGANRHVLTPASLGHLAAAIRANAADLLDDARALFSVRRWPRAYALAVLAAEECGKAEECERARGFKPENLNAWKTLERNLRGHKFKAAEWAELLLDTTCRPGQGESKSWQDAREKIRDAQEGGLVDAVTSGKLKALYVDYENGVLSIPCEQVTMRVAENMINGVARILEGDRS